MKKYSRNIIFIIDLLLFIFAITLENGNIYFLICVVNLIALLAGIAELEFVVLTSFILGSEMAIIFSTSMCAVYCFTKYKKQCFVSKKSLIAVLIVAFSAIYNMVLSGAVYNTFFGVMYYALVLFIGISFKDVLCEMKMEKALKYNIVIEFFCEVIICVRNGFLPGDSHKGTFQNAHFFGYWLICIIIFFFLYYKRRGLYLKDLLKNNMVSLGAVLFLFYLTDAKNITVSIIVTTLLYGVATIINKKNISKVVLSIAILYGGIFLTIFFLHQNVIERRIKEDFPKIGIYIYDSNYAYKFKYFEGTLFEELKGPRIIFGYGAGQYGSRVANMFGYNVMYREKNSINNLVARNFEPYILENYKKYASSYSDQFVKEIKYRSAVLSYPFSSLMAIIAENGIIGLALISYLFGKSGSRSKYGFLVIFLFVSCVFDLYFEHLNVIGITMVLYLNGNLNRKEKEQKCITKYEME